MKRVPCSYNLCKTCFTLPDQNGNFFDINSVATHFTKNNTTHNTNCYTRYFSKVETGLIFSSLDFSTNHATDSRICMPMVKNSSEILSILLNGGHSVVAGRLAGAFKNIGSNRVADDIVNTMRSAGYDVRETDPFTEKITFSFGVHEASPSTTRIRLMWNQMRETVIKDFPASSGLPVIVKEYLDKIDEQYVSDAYHSLSIEGYQVNGELIERVRSGKWNPNDSEYDNRQKDTMAARGYWQAFLKVKQSIQSVLNGENPGKVADADHDT